MDNRLNCLVVLVALLCVGVAPVMGQGGGGKGRVYNAEIEAHWLEGGTTFWYQMEKVGGGRDTFLVDAETGSVETIDSPRDAEGAKELVAEAEVRVSRGGGRETQIVFENRLKEDVKLFWIGMDGKPTGYGTVKAGGRRDQHTFSGHVWLVEGKGAEVLGVYEAKDGGAVVIDGRELVKRKPIGRRGRGGNREADAKEVESPDGKWAAFVREHDLWVREVTSGEEHRLSEHGSAAHSFHRDAIRARAMGMNYEKADYAASLPEVYWSPDSKRLVAMKTTVVEEKRVHVVESSPKGQLLPKLHSYSYLRAGDEIPQGRVHLFDVENCEEIVVDDELFENPWSLGRYEWAADSSVFRFLYNRRGHQVMRLIEVDGVSGDVRSVVNEESKTFVDYSQKTYLKVMAEGGGKGEVVWMSERDGWNHLFLYDLKTGEVVNQITQGEWVVRGVDRVDEEKRQIYFRVMGYYTDQDPYYVHYARVNFDGSDLVMLTEGDGTHAVEASPDRRWFVDTWSRVDLAPMHELRRASDGKLVADLGAADASELYVSGGGSGRVAPERFVAKGRDGVTDIFGIIHRPVGFDSSKKYAVIESIYAGPHGQHVPKGFRASYRTQQDIADAGYVVVQIDGMGTNWRSKAFHDVAWKDLADAGFLDRIAWMKAAGESRPWMDLNRVGVFGGSAGGQNAMRAVLDHAGFYKAAAADCGCHDNRMDKIWWNEAWMGWPVDESYAASSNVVDAGKLGGALLLSVGELDKNVDPASTMQVVDALEKAGKDFELLVVPGGGHGSGGAGYGKKVRLNFFNQHLKNKTD